MTDTNQDRVAVPVVQQIVVQLDQAGNIIVDGPVEDTLLCYALLEGAKDSCRRYAEERARLAQAAARAGGLVLPNGVRV